MNDYDRVRTEDAVVYDALVGETKRRDDGLELIPSENHTSRAVRQALGSVFTDKYAEGTPGKRYYGGQKYTDIVELFAMERAKAIFHCDHVNVQPLGGANANLAAYSAWLDIGDTVLAMDLGHGGHLTHGAEVTLAAKMYKFERYGMSDPDTGEIDYDEMLATAKRVRPKILLAGASAFSRLFDLKRMVAIANEVEAVPMMDIAHTAGLIAGGVHENPFHHGFKIVTTTTHKTLRGPRGGMIMSMGTVSNPLKAPEKTIENLPTLIDRSVFPSVQGGPHMHQIAAAAVCFAEARHANFPIYADQIVRNAKAMAKVFLGAKIRLIGGGTDNHLLLADVWSSLKIGGKEAERTLEGVGITLNANAIANDTRKRFDPSGIRFGTPAITSRGFNEEASARVAELMIEALNKRGEERSLATIRSEISGLSQQYGIPDSYVQ